MTGSRVWLWARRIVIGAVGLIAILFVTGATYEQLIRNGLPTKFPAPGEFISVNGRNLHLNCTGEGEPVVILESGFAPYGSLGWYDVQPAVSELTKTCSYDRAGYMWSDPGEGPRTGDLVAEDLHSLLEAASLPPPYVMAGHSAGGVFIRIYDQEFPGEVAGFVFVDSAHPEQQQRLPDSGGSTQPPPGLSLMTRTGLWRLIATPERPEGVTDEVHKVFETVFAYWPMTIHGLFAELSVVDQTARQLATIPGSLSPRPIVVLSRSDFSIELGDPEGLIEETRAAWMGMQDELAALSSNSEHRIVPNTSHEVQIDNPQAVIEAISQVVNEVRTGE